MYVCDSLNIAYSSPGCVLLRARSHSPSTTCCAKTVLRVASLLQSIPRRSVKSHAWPKHVYFVTQHVARRLVTVGDCCETAL